VSERLAKRIPAPTRDLRVVETEESAIAAIRAGNFDEAAQLVQQLKSPGAQLPDLAPVGVAEIFAPLKPVEYLLAPLDLCPGAPALVAGYGFSGKTLALQAMALSIASGQKVWGGFAAEQGRVVHVDYEQGSRLTYERYQRLAYDMGVGPSDIGDRLHVATMPSLYLDQPDGVAALQRAAQGARMVIIDSLRACAPSVDENSSEVRRVLDALGRVSQATGATVVVIHHARKPQKDAGGGAKASIRGSGAIFDACSSVMVFDGKKGGNVQVSHEKARNSGILTDDFELVIEDVPDGANPRRGLRVSAHSAKAESVDPQAQLDAVCKEILAVLDAEPGQSGREIRERLNRSPNTVSAAIDNLERRGLIRNTGKASSARWVKSEEG